MGASSSFGPPENWVGGFTGDYNAAFGHRALRRNLSGIDNTAVGAASLDGNLDGNSNTGIGRSALLLNQFGSRNVGIGTSAMRFVTGSRNVAVGSEAAINFRNGGDGNIFLGDGAGPAQITGFSNRLYIHNAANDMPLIYGDFDSRNLNFYVNKDIKSRVTITSSVPYVVNTIGTSGLKFANLKSTNLAEASNGKVLTVDEDGDVILVKDQIGIGTGIITSSCTTSNFVTKSDGTTGNIKCSEIYDDGAKHVGFFYGSSPLTSVNVSINGSLATTGIYNTSDKKFKTNIKPIESALEKVMQLEGKTYNWKKEAFKDNNFSGELQYGLIAQDVQKIIPSLVIASENGDLAMNYVGLIPVLIQALKEQQSQIEALKSQISENFQKQNQDLIALENTKIISVSPNPSQDVIAVSMNIDKSALNAKLMVYDLKGTILSSLNIHERDNNITRTLQKDNFGKGVYIVSLLINGKSIDSKKIIFN